ncbi:MAG: hypothetical protein GTO42_08670 [Candidatus Latescibacteria bacterium]|nr:hypothetical protein [Candidatus Latescibacterota bacterium]NIO29033.1 hypothetical protein [Candidatus Latescibacterota bacterium]NIO56658.1 hypothetical protein [Candidatus Latescibacterota bacterium]NIT02241.1 hypothetical protein [Candidatus Latescibacterota bacterium]NIT39126.1 hypothetical protein [Candidatus Latescibacterota bacterium]
MAPEMNESRRRIEQLQRVEPVEAEAAARADEILNSKTKQNTELDILNAKWATNKDLRVSPNFTHRKKLIMAEVLNLVADSLDPDKQQNVELTKLREAQKALASAINIGVGQMLQRLRPREILANQLVMWKANSIHAGASALPKGQTSMLLCPNYLIKPAFQKALDHELKSTNYNIGRGEYRSFMFLPFEKIEGESMSLIPYLRLADKYHLHIIGSLPLKNTKDSFGKVAKEWKVDVNSVNDEEQELLSHASVVANDLVIRDAYKEYHENEPLTVGLNTAFAAQMTRYFQREKKGQWFNPIIHPKLKPSEMNTVNVVDKLDAWRKAVDKQFNYAYTTTPSQDPNEPGVRVYGGATVFPEDAVDVESLGNQAVPLIQSQARVTKNRIYYFLVTQLERYVGGQEDPTVIKKEVERYLQDMMDKKQIMGWKLPMCEKDELGRYKIKVSVNWSSTADSFEIDAESRDEGEEAGEA